MDAATELLRLVDGYRVSQAIHVVAKLGIADLVRDDAKTASELAVLTDTRAEELYRLLRGVAAIGVLHEDGVQRFSLTETGRGLCADGGGVRDWAIFVGSDANWRTWGHLHHTVRTGENAFRAVHGTDVWSYRANHPDDGAVFDRAMVGLSRTVTDAVIRSCDFSAFGRIVDIGGGRGAFLCALLEAHPNARGVLFDRPHVVAAAVLPPGIAARVEITSGDVFEHIPEGGDAYVLKSVLHDWDNRAASKILTRCRAAMQSNARLYVIDNVIGPPNEQAAAKFADLHMMISPGGRERSTEEFDSLLATAGFRRTRVVGTGTRLSVIEAMPV